MEHLQHHHHHHRPHPELAPDPETHSREGTPPPPDTAVEIVRQVTIDIGPPPDGGLEAWLCVVATFLLLFCIFGCATSFGQLELYYLSHQLSGYSKSTVAWIGSCQSTLTFLGSIYTGRYFDSHGPRMLVIVGTVASVSALVAIAFCHEYYQFLLAHMLFGLSGTIIYAPATSISGHWFLKRRSTAVGIIVCGAGLGGVVYPIMFKQLFDQLSFRNTMLIVAGFNGVLMVPGCFFMKSRLPRRHPPPLKALAGPWHEARYVFLVVGSGLYVLNVFSPYFNAPTLATSNNLPANISSYAIAILQTGSFLGRASAGFMADAFGVWNVFGTMCFATSIVLFTFWTGSPIGTAATIIGLLLYGFVSGAWFTLVAAACAAISPTREIGMRLGMLWSFVGLPVLVGPVVCGLLINVAGGKFTYAGVFCGFTMLMAAFITPGPRLMQAIRTAVFGPRSRLEDAESSTETIVAEDDEKEDSKEDTKA